MILLKSSECSTTIDIQAFACILTQCMCLFIHNINVDGQILQGLFVITIIQQEHETFVCLSQIGM